MEEQGSSYTQKDVPNELFNALLSRLRDQDKIQDPTERQQRQWEIIDDLTKKIKRVRRAAVQEENGEVKQTDDWLAGEVSVSSREFGPP